MKRTAIVIFCMALSMLSFAKGNKTIPDWSKGYLDIHFINSARGECFFCIFPDGTTMMTDAGDTKTSEQTAPPNRPDSNTDGATVYSNYIRHFLPATGHDRLDYILLSHFHTDHFGDTKLATSEENGYKHFCLASIYDKVGADNLIDRGWPGYDEDKSIYFSVRSQGGNTSEGATEYVKFAKYAHSQGVNVERFALASDSQISMKRADADKYDFKVTNISVNGITFDKDGQFHSAEVNSENAACCAFHMQYGNFDFVSCGDLTGAPQNTFAKCWYSTCCPPLEVFKGIHHLHHNAWGSGMTSVGLKAQVVVGFCFCQTDPKHVTPDVLGKACAAGDTFITNAFEKSVRENEVYSQLKDYNGHFVVRVCPGGDKFYVYKLKDTDFSFEVLAKYGPYKCK